MSEIEEIETRVRRLPKAEFSKLRDWILQLDEDAWDRQISADFEAGKFDQLIEKARHEFAQGKARGL